MPYSMTGFARVESAGGDPSIEVLVRSVNHRFLDMKIRTPPDLDSADPRIRRTVKKHVRRGQLQINVNLRSRQTAELTLNRELAEAYLKAYRELAEAHGIDAAADLTALLRTPGIVGSDAAARSEDEQAALEKLLDRTLTEALQKLNSERRLEGEGLAADVRERAERIAAEAAGLSAAVSDVTPKLRERLERRLGELLGEAGVEQQRILQEAAILADRADISEELQRLTAHAARLIELLDQDEELGKQMDFVAQEMNREANTLLSKTTPLGRDGLVVTEAGLRLKGEIEKIREQAQNLE
jgi:uncharacterized protein (TIGR00255 family)